MLNRFIELVQKLVSTSGRLEKEAFLREYADDNEIKQALHFLFNPYIVTGISGKKLGKKSLPRIDTQIDCLLELIEYFKVNNSGRDVDVAVLHAFAEKHDVGVREVIYGLIRKDLKLGIQEKTLNKVFGAGFIPVMDVMLAESYFENQSYLEGKEFLITRKLDGVRAVLMFTEGNPSFFSRGGRVIHDLIELAEAASRLDPDYVYDGELLLQNPRKDMTTAEIYRATVKITASDEIKRGVSFNIFDRVLKADFVNGVSLQPAIERKTKLSEELRRIDAAAGELLKDVGIIYVGSDVSVIPKLLDEYTSRGEEGLMINPFDSPYECKRTKNLLKVKKFHAADVRVLSIEEGGGVNKGKLGAVYVAFLGPDGSEHTCKVGSGFSQEQRDFYFQNPDEILGKIIEIGYFEVSKNQNDDNFSLRFPTFKHLRDDKDEISMH